MADKTVTYKNKNISASLIDDFYNRLNNLRVQGGVSTLTVPSVQDETTSVNQMTSLYSAVLSTKNAISFLKNIDLSYSFAGVSAGDIMLGPDSVSIVEHNIGQMENACKAFFSTNKSGYSGSTNFSANHATNFGTNANQATNATHNAPKCTFFASNKAIGNSAHCLGFNSGVTNGGSFQPHHGSNSGRRGPSGRAIFTFFAKRSSYGFCPNGFNGCRAVRNCNNYNGFFNSNFSGNGASFTGFHAPNFTTFNAPVCTAVNSSHFGTVYNSNNTANFSGVDSVCTVVWGAYTVEGINDL